ncbi:hypothetical protein KKA27_00800, partial [Patescibacteria group bacterium]|nr:hypothetical protein [Patescibacteria group bacterium]
MLEPGAVMEDGENARLQEGFRGSLIVKVALQGVPSTPALFLGVIVHVCVPVSLSLKLRAKESFSPIEPQGPNMVFTPAQSYLSCVAFREFHVAMLEPGAVMEDGENARLQEGFRGSLIVKVALQ